MTFASRRLPVLAALTALALTIGVATEARAAAPIGADGLVHACYKAKGKGKGQLRVVKAGKKCKKKKGEKALIWGVQGPTGTGGSTGATGGNGSGVSTQNLFDLLALIQQQAGQITQLTDQLDALTGDVVSLSGVLEGVSNADLNAVIDSLPVLDTVCTQLSAVTGQANALRTVISGLGLNGVLSALGGLLQIPALPSALDPFACAGV